MKIKLQPIRIEIAKLEMKPGDRLMLKFPPRVTPEQLGAIAGAIRRDMPDLPTIILPAYIEASVISPPPQVRPAAEVDSQT